MNTIRLYLHKFAETVNFISDEEHDLSPVGIQSFEEIEIRKGDYCYVDKTAQIYQLVKRVNTTF